MSKTSPIPLSEREKIVQLRAEGWSIRKIAAEMGHNAATIQKYAKMKEESEDFLRFKQAQEEGLLADSLEQLRWNKKLAEERANNPVDPNAPPRYYDQKAPNKKKYDFANSSDRSIVTPTNQAQPVPNPQQPVNPLNMVHLLPPGGSQMPLAFQNYSGVFRGGQNFYLPADLAIQQSRENARAMYNNLIIREALQARWLAVAESDFHVEPEDKDDPEQVKIATSIQKIIEKIPNLLKMFVALLKSRWYGIMGVQLQYEQTSGKKLWIKDWFELNGDSLCMDMNTGEIGVYITMGTAAGAKRVTTVPGFIGQVHVFENGDIIKIDANNRPYRPINFLRERDAVIIMKFDPSSTDFLDSRNAGQIMGQGLRSILYPSWYIYQEIMGNMIDWLERIGSGVVMFKYKINDAASYQAAVTLAESQSNQAAIMVPVDVMENGGKPIEGVEIQPASAIGLDNFLRVISEFLAPQLRRMIVGQDSTSQETKAGLGSKIAEVHENTFSRICQYDSRDLEQTLTHQLVHVLQRWNFPGTEDKLCKFVMDLAKPNVGEQIQAAKTLADMGVEFDGDELRKLIGFSKPKEGATIVGGKQENPMEEMFGGKPGVPGENPFEKKENKFENHKDLKDAQLAEMEKGEPKVEEGE